ncbi:DsbA family protein [Tateyamaria sp. ANG-S1]|uniref:DsbA family protein n=1 Tax=Tateyamaria sp. ANG-S1 TaxID=1577905 RepID=UPI00057DAF3F|nr:DsbA family protein [Tateyamaria sp. ANG-S1]KIC49912.1 thiol-disulfide oxidoreductase [Tateyamaria sp. ANG-S1]
MNRIVALIAVLVGVGGYFLYSAMQSSGPNAQQQVQAERLLGAANAQEAASDIDTSSVIEMQLGNPDAPVTVIEYASYTCPHCATFHSGPFKQLKADYIDTGKVNFIYREVYFDRFGLWASAIARCAGTPESFFGITEMLYAGQSEWARAGGGDPAQIADELRKIGRLAGLDGSTLEACLTDADNLRKLVAWYQQNAAEDGINSTPTFVINGTTYNNMSYADMSGLIDEAAGS